MRRLRRLLTAVQTTSRLTRDEFAAAFGADTADIARIEAFAREQG